MTDLRVWIGAAIVIAIAVLYDAHCDSCFALPTTCTAARCV